MISEAPQAQGGLPSTKRKSKIAICAGLMALAFVTYGGYIANGWVFDDQELIVDSDWYEKPMRLGDLTADLAGPLCGRKMSYWRPGQLLMYRFLYALFGKNPSGWRFIAVVMHGLMACALSCLFLRYVKNGKLAFLTAALFLAHPAHTEVIGSNNISIPEGLLAVLGLLALLRGRVFLTALFAALALSVRESGLIVPLIYLLFALFSDKDSRKNRYVAAGASLAAVGVMTAVRFGILKHSLLSSPNPWPVVERMGMSAYLIMRTLVLPWPNNLAILHAPGSHAAQIITGWILITAVVMAFAGIYVFCRKTRDYSPLLFALAAGLAVGPYMGVFSLYIIFAQHYLYIPLAFTICALMMLLYKKTGDRAVMAAALPLIVIMAGISFSEAGVYRNDGAAFEDVLEKYPQCETALLNLGEYHYRAGNWEKAEESYKRLLVLTRGEHPKAWVNLGDIYYRSKHFVEAKNCFQKAGEQGRYNLAVLLINAGKLSEAGPLVEKLLKAEPEDATLIGMMDAIKKAAEKSGPPVDEN